jgi:hypothetical protein
MLRLLLIPAFLFVHSATTYVEPADPAPWNRYDMQLALQQSDDPESAAPEPGQPAQCDNHIGTPKDKKCECARAMQKCHGLPQDPADVRMDKKCKTYCRAQHCECTGSGCSG